MEDKQSSGVTQPAGKNGRYSQWQEETVAEKEQAEEEDAEESDSSLVPLLLAGILILAIGAVIVISLVSLLGH